MKNISKRTQSISLEEESQFLKKWKLFFDHLNNKEEL
jgi:hypothetical protein